MRHEGKFSIKLEDGRLAGAVAAMIPHRSPSATKKDPFEEFGRAEEIPRLETEREGHAGMGEDQEEAVRTGAQDESAWLRHFTLLCEARLRTEGQYNDQNGRSGERL